MAYWGGDYDNEEGFGDEFGSSTSGSYYDEFERNEGISFDNRVQNTMACIDVSKNMFKKYVKDWKQSDDVEFEQYNRKNMTVLDKCKQYDDEEGFVCPVVRSLEILLETMKQKVIQQSKDRLGVLFFGAKFVDKSQKHGLKYKEKSKDQDREYDLGYGETEETNLVHVFLKPEIPSVISIQKISKMLLSIKAATDENDYDFIDYEFQHLNMKQMNGHDNFSTSSSSTTVSSSSSATLPPLQTMLWSCQDVFNTIPQTGAASSSSSSRQAKSIQLNRIQIYSNDDKGTEADETKTHFIHQQCTDLSYTNTTLELWTYPILHLPTSKMSQKEKKRIRLKYSKFDERRYYRQLLEKCNTNENRNKDLTQLYDIYDRETDSRLIVTDASKPSEDIQNVILKKSFRKRRMSSMYLTIGRPPITDVEDTVNAVSTILEEGKNIANNKNQFDQENQEMVNTDKMSSKRENNNIDNNNQKNEGLVSSLLQIPQIQMGVSLYKVIQPLKRPKIQKLSKMNNEPITTKTYPINSLTAQKLDAPSIGTYWSYGFNNFAQMSTKEREEINKLFQPGIYIIGFLPASEILENGTLDMSLKSSTFVYPEENLMSGSICAFTSFLKQMSASNLVAIATYTRSTNAIPCLSLLIPQLEQVSYAGSVAREFFGVYDREEVMTTANEESETIDNEDLSSGFQLITLPYLDDIRDIGTVDSVPTYDITSNEQEDEARIRKCVELTETIGGEVESTIIPNPSLQKHYAYLQAHALHENEAYYNEEKDDVMLIENFAGTEALQQIEMHVKQVTNGLNFDYFEKKLTSRATANKSTAAKGTKRKLNDSANDDNTGHNAIDDDTLQDHFLPPDQDTFKKTTAQDLRGVLKSRGLAVSGSKQMLYDRLIDYLQNLAKYKDRAAAAKRGKK